MDYLYLDSICQEEEILWDMIEGEISGESEVCKNVSVQNKSDFRSYSYVKDMEQKKISSSTVNVKRRMVNLLTKYWEEKKKAAVPEKERCRRHMMKERTRRDKQKQSYLALHSLLPFPTKNDKNSIVLKAMDEISRLQRLKKELETRVNVMEANSSKDNNIGTKVNFKLQEPLSSLSSMVEVLQCLKSMETKVTTVHANFSRLEFSATINIDNPVKGEEVKERVERRLKENEWKLLFPPEASFLKD